MTLRPGTVRNCDGDSADGRDAHRVDAALEPRHAILANADRRVARAQGQERHRARALLDAVHVVPHASCRRTSSTPRASSPARCVRDGSSSVSCAGIVAQVGIERPAAAVQAQLDRARGSRAPASWHVKEPLLDRPVAIRREQHFDREPRQPFDADCASINRPSEAPLNWTAGPISVCDDRRRADDLDRIATPTRRQVVEAPGRDRRRRATATPTITPSARTTAASLMSLRRIERADQDAHVADIGIDRDAHQLRIRIRRRIGLVADVGLRKVAGLRRLRAVAPCRDGCCCRAAPASSPARSRSATTFAASPFGPARVVLRAAAPSRRRASAARS